MQKKSNELVGRSTLENELKETLNREHKTFQNLLGSPEKMRRFVQNIALACAKDPALLDPSRRKSLISASFEAATVGLEVGSNTKGEGALVRFGDQVQFIPMYRGLIKLALQSGEVSAIWADEVCENDVFEEESGLYPKLVHKPNWGDRGRPILYYAVAVLANGIRLHRVLTMEEVIATRDRSSGWRAFKAGRARETPWNTDAAEMAKKTAIRRLYKIIPFQDEKVNRAVELSDAEFEFEGQRVPDGPPTEPIRLRTRPRTTPTPEPEAKPVEAEAQDKPRAAAKGDNPEGPPAQLEHLQATLTLAAQDMGIRESDLWLMLFPNEYCGARLNPPNIAWFGEAHGRSKYIKPIIDRINEIAQEAAHEK